MRKRLIKTITLNILTLIPIFLFGAECNIKEVTTKAIKKKYKHSYTRKRKRFKCKFCPHFSSSEYNLTIHMKKHSSEREFKCSICLADFKLIQHLNRHIDNHNGNKLFLCYICGHKFKQKSNLERHMGAKHPKSFDIINLSQTNKLLDLIPDKIEDSATEDNSKSFDYKLDDTDIHSANFNDITLDYTDLTLEEEIAKQLTQESNY